jgi:hypothetical protein
VRADVPAGAGGWHRAADLLEDGQRLRALVEQGAQALAGSHPESRGGVRSTVAAAVLLSDWCWALAALGAGALAADRRVPVLDPGGVWLQVDDGRVTGVASTSAGFHCGAADPAAQHADARCCADLDGALRMELTAHLSRLHAALRSGPTPLLRRGPRAMWGAAGDGVATALRLQAEQVERPEDLLDTAERLLAAAPASWGRHGFDRTADGVSRVRTSCCLWYRLPETPACATCPRTCGRAPVPA